MIDLRSDTVTKPTPGMLDAMLTAEVGDDVFESDPTVNALQEKTAAMFGMESSLYCPSGTMTNQIALRVLTNPQDAVICDQFAHIYMYEGGGLAYNSMLSPKLLIGERGRLNAEMVAASINPDDIHYPKTSLVSIENTMNKGGGSIYDLSEIRSIRSVCDENNLFMHLDGARLFNALIESGDAPEDFGKLFDMISVCFSKGMGAPVGSVLIGSQENIRKARRVRKAFGGGMRQSGYLAAACIYALDHHVERLEEDHLRAREIGTMMSNRPYVRSVMPVDTNIVICELVEEINEKTFIRELSNKGVMAVAFGTGLVRFVTHLDFTDDHLQQFRSVLNKLVF